MTFGVPVQEVNLKYLILGVVLISAYTTAQTCIIPAPPRPPTPRLLIITLPEDGGTQGCTANAPVVATVRANEYPIANAKCATAVQIAKQAAANDNGWNDGGVP